MASDLRSVTDGGPRAVAWPAVTYEPHEWTPRASVLQVSRRTIAATADPYEAERAANSSRAVNTSRASQRRVLLFPLSSMSTLAGSPRASSSLWLQRGAMGRSDRSIRTGPPLTAMRTHVAPGPVFVG
jgi:hypothetical protein